MDRSRPAYGSQPPPSHHPSYPPPPTQSYPTSSYVEPRPPPPAFAQPHPHSTPQAHHPSSYTPHPPPPIQAGPSLPPIQQTQQPSSLPPLHYSYQHPPPHHQQPPPPQHPQQHHPTQPPQSGQEAREAPEYHPYNHHNRSSHATPAPVQVNRSYSHDSAHHQRTPTTPAHSGPVPYPPAPAPAPDGPPQQTQASVPPMDHAHHAYPPTNGVPHGLPPPQQHGMPQHHEQPPPGHMTPVDGHYQYASPAQQQPMYPPASYGPASTTAFATNMNNRPKKQMRATQACEQCRQRKQKCDEGNPCSFCKEQGLSCQYRDTPPAKTDKNMEKMMQYMESHSAALQQLMVKMDNFDHRLHGVETTAFRSVDSIPAGPPVHQQQPYPEMTTEPIQQIAQLDDHRTAPHKLFLLWPTVKTLLQQAGVDTTDSYVMEAEDRGIMRIWTRGEGIDEYDGTHPGGPASPAHSEDSGDGSAPSPPSGQWGTGFPQIYPTEASRPLEMLEGGLKADNTLDLEVETINALFTSYMKHIHIMHPFLDDKRLRRMFDTFIKRYSTGAPQLRQKFAVSNHSDHERPLKRQRSNGSAPTGLYGQDSHTFRLEVTERSPSNAIVWLVMALGKICAHKAPLEGHVEEKAATTNMVLQHGLTNNSGFTGSSPVPAIKTQPDEMSPRSTSTAQPTPPNMDGMVRPVVPRSRRPSIEGYESSRARNLDVVPGLAYYAKACEIMGDQADGNDLVHAQMFLLAGLYKGQLARVKESMSWFNMAGRALRMLLDRYKLFSDKYWEVHGDDVRHKHLQAQQRITEKRHNLIVLASWTCLQLESDILAEMRLPSSGIGTLEDMLLMPMEMNDRDEDNYEGLVTSQDLYDRNNLLIYYVSQTFLRKRLNKMHKEIYSGDSLDKTPQEVVEMLSGHQDTLEHWRAQLPPGLRWDDVDPPATNILDARLRAKYWGAKYVANRPFLDYALHIMGLAAEDHPIEQIAKDSNGRSREKAEIHLFKAIKSMGETQIWEASRRCIDAAMQSTIAFDGIEGPNNRLIVTNIHGTAHAQFGNMLVLSAAHSAVFLRTFVPREKFEPLMTRTISFLRRLRKTSVTARIDCFILEKLEKVLFGVPPDAKHIYANEGVEQPSSASTSFGHNT